VYYEALINNAVSQQVSRDLRQLPVVDSPANSLLPQNFVKTNSDQLPIPINEKSLNYKLDNNFADLQKNINNDVSGRFSQLAGISSPSLPVPSISMSSLESNIQKAQDQFSIKSNNQMLSIFNSNKQVESLGAINQSYTGSINNSTNLSPRSIRDLKSSDILKQQISNTTSNAVAKAKDGIKEQVSSLTQNQTFNQSGQTNLQQLSVPAFSGDNKEGFELFVRLTVYWANGSGTDNDSAAKRSSTGRQLAQGVSAAVDPLVIPYLSRLEIPGIGIRFATDTGGAVKARTASAGRLPIIDIFFENKEEALAAANKMRKEVNVKVYPPVSRYKYVKNAPPTYGVA